MTIEPSEQTVFSVFHQPVAWFVDLSKQQNLDLHAPFQRNPVWKQPQKAYLLDTILHGLPIPELYIQTIVDARGGSRYVVVDGQQRIRACIEFIEGKFPLTESAHPDLAGKYFSDLNILHQHRIYKYQFVCRALPEMSAADLREIFKRLNRNVISLNKQELRHATYWGEFITLMERIADRPFWADAGIFTPNAVRRMLDVEFVSELTIALLHGVQNKKESLDDWYQAYADSFPDAARVGVAFDHTIAELREVVPEFHGTRWRKKSDFYTLFLAIAARLESGNPIDRPQTRTRLEQFQAEVTEVLKNTAAEVPAAVRDYASAVERAASDRANRRARLSRLRSYLEWE